MDACERARKSWSWRIAFAAVATMLVGGAGWGCKKAEWDDPEFLAKKMKKGSMTEQKKALDKYDEHKKEFDEEAIKKKIAPGLAKIYLEEGAHQKKAMQFLVSKPSPEATEAYLEELKDDTAGYAGGAAEALGKVQAKDAISDLLELYQTTGDDDQKIAILRGLRHMPTTEMVQPLIKTLRLDVDNNPIPLHSHSCDILGDVAQESPDAFNEKARRTLVRAMFLSNKKGQTVKSECSLAVQKLGEPAIPILVETFEGENEQVQKLLLKYRKDTPKQFPPNRSLVYAVQRLTSLRAKQAPDLYLERLESESAAPEDLPDNLYAPWRTKEANARDEMILGLGDLGADKASDFLTDFVSGEYNDKYDSILDPLSELQLRQDAASAVMRLGDRDATDVLLEMAEDGVIEPLESRAEKLAAAEQAKPMPVQQRYQFNWRAAQAFAMLATGEAKEDYESLIESWSGKELKPLREKLASFKPAIEKAGECLGKNGKGAKAKCWGKALESDDKAVRKKAAWELTWMPKTVAGETITKHLDTEELETREILTVGLYRNPHEGAIEKIGKILEDESDMESEESYKLDHYRLKLLRAWLKNHFS